MQRYDYIPLDGFKLQLFGVDLTPYREGKILDFEHKTKKGGELHYMEHEHNGVKFRIYESGLSYIYGSFHKYFNQGEHNHNDFDLNAFRDVLSDFCKYFKVTPDRLQIIHLEFGFNIVPPIPTKELLKGLIQHKGVDFEHVTMNGKGNYKQAVHNRYRLKIYDKGLQYGLRGELLRIEHKVTNWTKYRVSGEFTLHDFIQSDKGQFLNELLSSIDEVILYDNTIHGLEPYHKYSNPNFWRNTRETLSSKTFNKHRHRLNALSKTKGSNLIERIKENITNKFHELQGVTNSKSLRKCRLTGVDISTQREDSFLLSHSGLKNLIEQNPREFERIKRRFLNSHWFTKDIQTQVKEIAHNIRSRYNHRTRLQRHGQRVLF
jgi:hypothetical protein